MTLPAPPLPRSDLPRYDEVAPPVALAPWVACLWQIRGALSPGAPVLHRILPDGCVDLVLEPGRAAAARLVGPMTTAVAIAFAGELDLVGLRLRPGGLALLAAFPASELVDAAIEPGAAGAPLRAHGESLSRDLASLSALAERARRVWAALLPLRDAAPGRDPLLVHALASWSSAEGAAATVGAVVRNAGVSERTLERRFVRAAGLRPAELRRLARFRRALRLRAAGETRWSMLAAGAGYADQAHLAREFRRFAGVTPTEWVAEQARAGFVQDGSVAAF